MDEYAREHGSNRTEVRGDGSIAEFSDPAEGFEGQAPAQVQEQGTTVVPDGQGGEEGQAEGNPDAEAQEQQEENA